MAALVEEREMEGAGAAVGASVALGANVDIVAGINSMLRTNAASGGGLRSKRVGRVRSRCMRMARQLRDMPRDATMTAGGSVSGMFRELEKQHRAAKSDRCEKTARSLHETTKAAASVTGWVPTMVPTCTRLSRRVLRCW